MPTLNASQCLDQYARTTYNQRLMRGRLLAVLMTLGVVGLASESARADHRVWVRGDAFSFPASVELEQTGPLASAGGSTVLRYEQRYGGLRVVGKGIVVRVGAAGDVRHVVVDLARDLALSTTPTVTEREARAILASRGVASPARTELVVTAAASAFLVWQLDVRDDGGGTRYRIDAQTGEVLTATPLAVHALGRIYETDLVTTPAPVDVELTSLDVTLDPVRLRDTSGLLAVTDLVSISSDDIVLEQAPPTAGQDFLYDPPSSPTDLSDPFAQVNAYQHLMAMRLFAGELGVVIDQPSWQLTAVANFRLDDDEGFDNAYFSSLGVESGPFAAPNLIALGQGTNVDFAYDSDVIKHEFGHYLSSNAIGYNLGAFHENEYGRSPHSSSIDEGLADYLACSDNDDPILGGGVLASLGFERDLEDTSKRCPDDIVGESHADGEIIGSVSWSVRALFGKTIADELVWGAATTLPQGATLGDFGTALILSAEELALAGTITSAEVADVEALVEARGLDECEHVIPLDPGETKTQLGVGLDALAAGSDFTCAELQTFGYFGQGLFHFSRATQAADPLLRFSVEAEADGPGQPEFSIYVRKGDNVEFMPTGPGLIPLPEPAVFDLEVAVAAASGEIVLDGADFEAGAEYFFALVNRGCPDLRFTVSASTEDEPMPTTSSTTTAVTTASATTGSGTTSKTSSAATTGAGGEGGASGDGGNPDDDGGCDCRGGGSSPRGFGLGLIGGAFAIAALARRRRRQ